VCVEVRGGSFDHDTPVAVNTRHTSTSVRCRMSLAAVTHLHSPSVESEKSAETNYSLWIVASIRGAWGVHGRIVFGGPARGVQRHPWRRKLRHGNLRVGGGKKLRS